MLRSWLVAAVLALAALVSTALSEETGQASAAKVAAAESAEDEGATDPEDAPSQPEESAEAPLPGVDADPPRPCHARVSSDGGQRCKNFGAAGTSCAGRCEQWCDDYMDDHPGVACACYTGKKPRACRAAEASP